MKFISAFCQAVPTLVSVLTGPATDERPKGINPSSRHSTGQGREKGTETRLNKSGPGHQQTRDYFCSEI